MKIPSLGESVTEATLGRWLKQDGDAVSADEPILELESDKANMELAAESAGVLRILTGAGETVHFGDVVGRIEAGGGAAGTKGPSAAAAVKAAPQAAGAGAATARADEPAQSPAVRRIVEEERLDPARIEGTGPGGRILKADAQAAADRKRSTRDEPSGGARGILPSELAAAAVARAPAAPAK
ncbi:MAG: biotin/lipoyl-containing protein, partial [Alphaproteobacteria bacterium]